MELLDLSKVPTRWFQIKFSLSNVERPHFYLEFIIISCKDQEKQMKDGALVCTWVQSNGVRGDARGVYGGDETKMIIFFGQGGVMTDRKFVNGALICPDWHFRLR